MSLQEIPKQRLDATIKDLLMSSVLSGDFNQGEILNINEIAQKCGVSRTPVVQALKILTSAGVFAVSDTGKVYLPSFTIQQVIDLSKVRIAMESLAVREVCVRASDEDFDLLDKLIKDCDYHFNKRNSLEFRKADFLIHTTLVQLSENEYLTGAYTNILNQFIVANNLRASNDLFSNVSITEHRLLLDEMRHRSVEKAEQLITLHIQNSANQIIALMNT